MRWPRLNGWKRIGLVLSVVWAVVGAFWGWKLALDPEYEVLHACLNAATTLEGSDYCWASHSKALSYTRPWNSAAIVGLAPIPITWLLVWGLVAVVRWIRRGFAPSP
jgi:hypothetical protein